MISKKINKILKLEAMQRDLHSLLFKKSLYYQS